jgi:predicted nucleic acid-binding protein
VAEVIADTGPLVAYFDRSADSHEWVREQFEQLEDPLLCCQPVITEALFLLKRDGLNPDWILAMVERGDLLCGFDLAGEIPALRRLLHQYRDLPATLADVCLVRMSEIHPRSVVLTLDRDFLVYRKNKRQNIPLLAPFA